MADLRTSFLKSRLAKLPHLPAIAPGSSGAHIVSLELSSLETVAVIYGAGIARICVVKEGCFWRDVSDRELT